MKIVVHIKDKSIGVQCGEEAQQPIRWLGNVAIARYSTGATMGMDLGAPKGVRLEDGTALDMDAPVSSCLKENAHVWVVLRDEQ